VRRGQIDCLEGAVQTNPPRISEAMKTVSSWAAEEVCPRARRAMSRAARSVRRFVSAEAVTQRSKSCTDPLGIARAFGAETPTPGSESKPRPDLVVIQH